MSAGIQNPTEISWTKNMKHFKTTESARRCEVWILTTSNGLLKDFVSVDKMDESMSMEALRTYALSMHKLKRHPSIISFINSIEEKKWMVFEHYNESLEDGLRKHSVGHFFELSKIQGEQLYGFASRLKNIVKIILNGLERLSMEKMSYQELSTMTVVFKDDDEDYKEPLLIDLFDLQGGDMYKHLWRNLANLINHIIKRYQIVNKVSPEVTHFLYELKERQWGTRDRAKKLKEHPALLDKGGKLMKIIQIREKVYDNIYINLDRDFSAKVCGGSNWKSYLQKNSPSEITPYLQLMFEYRADLNNPYRDDYYGLLDLVRNMSEHLNENVQKYNQRNTGSNQLKKLTKAEIEALIEENFPFFLSHLFNRVDETNWLK